MKEAEHPQRYHEEKRAPDELEGSNDDQTLLLGTGFGHDRGSGNRSFDVQAIHGKRSADPGSLD
jgi:hypothetical protein